MNKNIVLLKNQFLRLIYGLILVGVYLMINRCVEKKNEVTDLLLNKKILNKDILVQSSQIIPNNSDLILIYNLSDDVLRPKPYLLFYNSNKYLYSVKELLSDRVLSVDKNEIICSSKIQNGETTVLNNQIDFSETYKIKYKYDLTIKHSMRISNKVVDEIAIDDCCRNIVLSVSISDGLFDGLQWVEKGVGNVLIDDFILKDTLHYKISDLIFNYKNQIIERKYIENNCIMIYEYMIVYDKNVFDMFYENLWNKFMLQVSKFNSKFRDKPLKKLRKQKS